MERFEARGSVNRVLNAITIGECACALLPAT